LCSRFLRSILWRCFEDMRFDLEAFTLTIFNYRCVGFSDNSKK
jgi:hypothetical protein